MRSTLPRFKRRPPPAAWCFGLLALTVSSSSLQNLHASEDVSARIRSLIQGLDLDEARRVLARADVDDPLIALERARLSLYELDCDAAVITLTRSDVLKADGATALADVARGCQRATAALLVDKDEGRGIEVRWQDEQDRSLAPLVMDTVTQARETLTRDLGVDWPRPTRIVVVRDLLSLSAMTGLPYSSAQTTGTVGVAKWGRITLLSPRASPHGYPWRDTLAHELTHLAVTRASGERAPLWLQEGIAKREEVRWRAPGPFDDRPAADAVAAGGIERGLAKPLDQMGPSIAMLPSAEAAMVAFAEVTSFVRFYQSHEGGDALPKLLRRLKGDEDVDHALVAASGADLKTWDTRWRSYVTSVASGPHLKKAETAEEKKREGRAWRWLRERMRLAELLLARGHGAQALTELDRKPTAGAATLSPDALDEVVHDPSARWLRAEVLDASRGTGGDLIGGEARERLLADPNDVTSSFGPWWALRGRWASLRGDIPTAGHSYAEALSVDPLSVEAACGGSAFAAEHPMGAPSPNAPAPVAAPSAERAEPLGEPDPAPVPWRAWDAWRVWGVCDAARARGEPLFAGD